MDIGAFTKPNGKFIKNHDNKLTFLPNSLPPPVSYDAELVRILSDADQKLGQLRGIGLLLPNPDLLIQPYLRREAVLSSKIEGTQASISDLFRYEITGREEKHEGVLRIREVNNYVNASKQCLKEIQTKEIDLDLVRNAHNILMADVRGQEKNPGQFRQIQNWIGIEGETMENAVFVPPPPQHVDEGLTDLIKFIQKPVEDIPPLIQCAMIHYQFEAIHPFADGNGRIGRGLITLFLAKKDLLRQPLLYLSAYFENHRTEYYNGLLAVSQKSKWREWFKFFLTAISVQSKDAINNIQQLMSLRAKYETMMRNRTSGKNALLVCEYLFANPYVTFKSVQEYLGCSFPAAQTAIKQLMTADILKEIPHRRRNRLFYAHEIYDILK